MNFSALTRVAHVAALVLAPLLFGAPRSSATEEIAEPAGAVPLTPDDTQDNDNSGATDGDAGGGVGASVSAGDGEEGAGGESSDKAPAKGEQKAKHKSSGHPDSPPAADAATETWDSYNDAAAAPSIAQEVTKGVRVEDIVEPPSEYRYAAFGKPDPFVPPLLSERGGAVGTIDALEIPVVSPLQCFKLYDLQVVGIWQIPSGERKAMVMTNGDCPHKSANGQRQFRAGAANKQGIIVKVGDPIGSDGGKVLGIGEDFLTVREFTLAGDGTRQYKDQQMYMERNVNDLTGKNVYDERRGWEYQDGDGAAASKGNDEKMRTTGGVENRPGEAGASGRSRVAAASMPEDASGSGALPATNNDANGRPPSTEKDFRGTSPEAGAAPNAAPPAATFTSPGNPGASQSPNPASGPGQTPATVSGPGTAAAATGFSQAPLNQPAATTVGQASGGGPGAAAVQPPQTPQGPQVQPTLQQTGGQKL